MATTTDHDGEKDNIQSGKRLVADWVLGLGKYQLFEINQNKSKYQRINYFRRTCYPTGSTTRQYRRRYILKNCSLGYKKRFYPSSYRGLDIL